MSEPTDRNHDADVDACLVRIQQRLISQGYTYIDGDPDQWPRYAVWMRHRDSLLFICPVNYMAEPQLHQLMGDLGRSGGYGVGVLLVGGRETESPEIEGIFARPPAAMAYVDAVRGKYRRYWKHLRMSGSPPRVLTGLGLRKLLQPIQGKASNIDCRAVLNKNLEDNKKAAQFHSEALLAGGAGRPYLTYAIIGACVLGYVPLLLTDGSNMTTRTLVEWGALYGPLVHDGEYWRILSASLLHASFMHIAMNGLALHIFGTDLEAMQGKWRVLVCYIFSVITASLASLLWNPTVISVGASGGVFGLIGLEVAMLLRFKSEFPAGLWRKVAKGLLVILVLNAILLFIPYIDGAAHAGGFAGGLMLGLLLSRSPTRLRRVETWELIVTGLLLCLTAAFGFYVISRIPAVSPL